MQVRARGLTHHGQVIASGQPMASALSEAPTLRSRGAPAIEIAQSLPPAMPIRTRDRLVDWYGALLFICTDNVPEMTAATSLNARSALRHIELQRCDFAAVVLSEHAVS